MKKIDENKKTLPAEKAKKPKKTKAVKVPKLLTKKYTAKQLEKKIYKKIYIADDKKFVKSLIQEAGATKKGEKLYSIPSDTKLPAKEGKRLVTISGEIKKHKGTVKLAPIFAVIIFVSLVCTGVTLTKNILARLIITNTCESIFEAKTDIKNINISFRNSSFKLKGLQIANKNEPMKNLISIDSIIFDFDFKQLLRSRIVVDELAVDGVATNTDRTTSGDITQKKLAKIQKKKAKKAKRNAKSSENSEFMKLLNSKSTAALDTLKSSVNGLFDQYNPQKIIDNCYTQLQTPETSKKVQDQAKDLVIKYQNKPKEIEAEINKAKTSIEAASKIDINSFQNNPAEIQEAITTINDAITSVNQLQSLTENVINGMKSDVDTATNLSKDLNNAIKHDQNLVNTELNKITSINANTAKNFITDTFNNIGYSVLGKYYPYVQKTTNFLINLKNTNKAKAKKVKTEKTKSTVIKRSKGRTIYFNTDTAPKVWIKKASGSGTNFSLKAANITTDMDKINKPATAKVNLNIQNITHDANLVIDTRSASAEPLINADYTCSKLPLSFPASNFGDVPGIPGIESTNAKLNLNMKIFETAGFTIGGTSNFTNMVLKAAPFEPEFASTLFSNTLSKIDSMNLSINAGYKEAEGVIMNLKTDADKKFVSALTSALTAQMGDVVANAKTELTAKITELSGGALGDLNKFTEVSKAISGYDDYIKSLNSQLEAKKKEATDAITGAATNKAKDAINNAAKDLFKKKF